MIKKREGFSLIELLLVLAVIVGMALAAFVVYPKVTSDMKSKRIIESTNAIYSQILTLKESQRFNLNDIDENNRITCYDDPNDQACFKKYGIDGFVNSGDTTRYLIDQNVNTNNKEITIYVVGILDATVCSKVANSLLSTHGKISIDNPKGEYGEFERDDKESTKKILSLCDAYNDKEAISEQLSESEAYDPEFGSISLEL